MQWIAEDPVHVVVRNEFDPISDGKGNVVSPARRHVYAKFKRGVAPEWAKQVGLETFEFRRMPGDITREQWLAYYDSIEDQVVMGWTDEERKAIEEKLQRIEGLIVVEKPRIAPPWPAYDKLEAKKGELSNQQVAARIAAKVDEDEYDVGYVIAYERENRGRKSVLAALEQLLPAPPDPAAVEEEDEELVEA